MINELVCLGKCRAIDDLTSMADESHGYNGQIDKRRVKVIARLLLLPENHRRSIDELVKQGYLNPGEDFTVENGRIVE